MCERIEKLKKLFPKTTIKQEGSIYAILDSNNYWMGEINPHTNTVTLYTTYKYFHLVEKRLKMAGINLFDRELAREIIKVIETETNYGKVAV